MRQPGSMGFVWLVVIKRGGGFQPMGGAHRPHCDASVWRDRREVLRLRVPALRAKPKARDTSLRMTTDSPRRIADVAPSMFAGHSMLRPYKSKKARAVMAALASWILLMRDAFTFGIYFSAAASSFSSGCSLAAAFLPFFSFFFSSEPMNSRIASSAPSPIRQPVRTILV